MALVETFWLQDCRGPALRHTHHDHVGDNPNAHADCPCRDCGVTPRVWARLMEMADPDSLPLALPQPGCGDMHHAIASRTLLVGGQGLEWPTCAHCNVQIEPKLATGQLSGSVWGPGRGWVSPRMYNRWAAIAYRLAGQLG